jgi:uncharacterized membrane protein YdjX (TVP38/TMEM64 family)
MLKDDNASIDLEVIENPATLIKYLNKFTFVVSIICYLCIAYLVIFHFELIRLFFTDYTKLYSFLTEGIRGPVFLIALLFNIVLSINPFAQLVPLTSIIAFFYGFEKGLVFAILTVIFSTILTLMLSRNFGNTAVKKIIGESNWKKVKILANEEGSFPFFIAHLFPVFPDAIVVWIAGITSISIAKLTIVGLLARLPGITLSVLIGSGLVTENIWLTGGLFATLVAISALLAKFRKQIMRLINQNK